MSLIPDHTISYNRSLFIIVIFLITIINYGQTTKYGQFWGEVQFNRTLSTKWSTELDLGTSYSSTESSPNIFDQNTQRSFRAWGHYFLSPRWKLSAFAAYYNNKDVPEIGQFASPEWRFALQGIYYFHKTGYTLSTRSRIELRYMKNEENEYENVLRYRQQIKYIQPLNSKRLRAGVVYAVASDEIFLKSGAEVTGHSFFDRNRLNIGAGYLFTDDIQIEATYANEYLPRDNANKIINAAAVTLTFNNFFKKINNKILHNTASED